MKALVYHGLLISRPMHANGIISLLGILFTILATDF